MNIILLSGGSGKRLWPLSNNIRSKQFLKIFKKADGSHESMVQRMYRMIKSVDENATITIATSENQVGMIRSQLEDNVNISIEPCRRDTFPAIALATAYLHDRLGIKRDDAVVVCPVDPYVDEDYFQMLFTLNEKALIGSSNLTLMGIDPTYPSAKYGYIIPQSKDEESTVESFREKPTEADAEILIKRGALWNGGVFAYKLSYVLDKSKELLGTDSYDELFADYENLTKISFDYAVVEKEQSISVLRFHGAWKDLGTWNTLTEAMSDEVSGKAVVAECENVHVINELQLPLIALGLKDAVVAATADGILVSDKRMSSYLKDYVANQRPMTEKRAWGEYEVLDYRSESFRDDNSNSGSGETGCQQTLTKHLLIKAGRHISYQRHQHRTETWVVIEGNGEVILDGEKRTIKRGDTIIVPLGTKHGIKANTNLHIIEVQIGDELTEEDIERLDWDWTAMDRYDHWMKAEFMVDELEGMSGSDIEDAFGSDLHFGTGGLRAVMGAGTNRMNTYTVAKASQGVANYLTKRYEKPSIAIAYDTRHHSKEFADVAASVFRRNGIEVHIFSEPVPTPLLSYAVWNLNCSVGIVITASHNSKEYNGYKIYDENGCQITDQEAKEIQAEIDAVDLYSVEFNISGKFETVSEELYKDYIESVQAASYVNKGEHDLKILYSPLNGTGLKFVQKALRDSGFNNISVVPEHELPDGDFTTCPYPNPEVPEVLEHCVPYASEVDADIIIATDPDCDRIGVMCRQADGYVRLNPNEVGVLMLDFICQSMKSGGDNHTSYTPVFMKTIVTTSMAEKVAERHGLKTINTLTGFKYIGEQIEKLKFVEEFFFGMEESCGYLSNPQIRDKDGVNAALLISVVAQGCKDRGITLYDRMQELYKEYGYYLNCQKSYRFDAADGAERMKSIMDKIHMPLPEYDGLKVVDGIDYSEGYLGLPPTNMREYRLSEDSRFLIRPSGTEPKLKVYIEAVGKEAEVTGKKKIITEFIDRLMIDKLKVN